MFVVVSSDELAVVLVGAKFIVQVGNHHCFAVGRIITSSCDSSLTWPSRLMEKRE